MQADDVVAIVLAAGKGKRMHSDLPKVLHPVLGRPMLEHVLDAVVAAGARRTVVVVGHGADAVRAALAARGVEFALQAEQLGTGHAVRQAEPWLAAHRGTALVLCGDTPLLGAGTLRALLATHASTGAAATVLTAELPDPTGYGRIVRGAADTVLKIVEHKDASPAERAIREINSGLFAFSTPDLFAALAAVGRDNAQGEYYLTDTLEILLGRGRRVSAHRCADANEVLGINTPEQLAHVEDLLRARLGHA